MFLNFKLNFQEHFETFRPHLDYGNIIYDQVYNASFSQKIESIQYNAALAITRAVCGTSKEKVFEDLGLEFVQHR